MAGIENTGAVSAGVERGELLQVLLRHCREIKREESRFRWATGFLLLSLCAAFLWIQVSTRPKQNEASMQQMTDIGKSQAQNRSKPKERSVISVHLLGAIHTPWTVPTTERNGSFYIQWKTQDSDSRFKLIENNTSVLIPTRGWYLVTLRISYLLPYDKPCQPNDCFLSVTVLQNPSAEYQGERKIMVAEETMRSVAGKQWYQAIHLNRVVKLTASAALSVSIEQKNSEIIRWDTSSYFEVTRL